MLPCPSATVKQHTTVNDQPVKEPTTANDQSMMEQLKKIRANRKYVLMMAYKATKRTALEHNRDAVLAHRQLLMTAFKLFEKASNEYLEVLEREEDVQCAEDYYDIEEKVYIENMKMLNSAIEELSCYSDINDKSSDCVPAMSLLLNMSTAVIPACEPELSHVPQNEPSESVNEEQIPLPDIHPDSSVKLPCSEIHTCSEPTDPATSSDNGTSHFISSKVIEQKLDNKYSVTHNPIALLSEHVPGSESEVPSLSQKEQLKCMASMCDELISSPGVVSESPVSPSPPSHDCMTSMCEEHIPSPEVIPDPPVPPSCSEICSDPHRSASQNYHDQQTINLHQCAIQLCIDNLSADQMSKHVHYDEHDNHSSDYETLFKQPQPCSVGAQSLISDQLMCLNYSARDPSNIDSVNDSGMLVSQNLPGG